MHDTARDGLAWRVAGSAAACCMSANAWAMLPSAPLRLMRTRVCPPAAVCRRRLSRAEGGSSAAAQPVTCISGTYMHCRSSAAASSAACGWLLTWPAPALAKPSCWRLPARLPWRAAAWPAAHACDSLGPKCFCAAGTASTAALARLVVGCASASRLTGASRLLGSSTKPIACRQGRLSVEASGAAACTPALPAWMRGSTCRLTWRSVTRSAASTARPAPAGCCCRGEAGHQAGALASAVLACGLVWPAWAVSSVLLLQIRPCCELSGAQRSHGQATQPAARRRPGAPCILVGNADCQRPGRMQVCHQQACWLIPQLGWASLGPRQPLKCGRCGFRERGAAEPDRCQRCLQSTRGGSGLAMRPQQPGSSALPRTACGFCMHGSTGMQGLTRARSNAGTHLGRAQGGQHAATVQHKGQRGMSQVALERAAASARPRSCPGQQRVRCQCKPVARALQAPLSACPMDGPGRHQMAGADLQDHVCVGALQQSPELLLSHPAGLREGPHRLGSCVGAALCAAAMQLGQSALAGGASGCRAPERRRS